MEKSGRAVESVWRLDLSEDQLLFLTSLMATFNYVRDDNTPEYRRGLLATSAFALSMGEDAYVRLWHQIMRLAKTTPEYQDFTADWPAEFLP